jgi:hypothetical protein
VVERWSLKPVVTGSNPVMPSMKRYKIVGKIVLSFIFNNEQKDYLLGYEEGAFIESNGITVWYCLADGEVIESITTANVIDVGLKRGDIEEIKDEI